MSKVTLQTIVERLGVSRMTVSNAFSRPDQLSAELRQRVLDAADQLGYVGPDPSARALAKGTTVAVGVLLTDSLRIAFTDQVATEFLGAIVDELAPTDLALTLLTVGGNAAVVPARDVAPTGRSSTPAAPSRSPRTARPSGLPVVFDDQKPQPGVARSTPTTPVWKRAVVQRIVDLGHRRVGVLNATADGRAGGRRGSARRRARLPAAPADARLVGCVAAGRHQPGRRPHAP